MGVFASDSMTGTGFANLDIGRSANIGGTWQRNPDSTSTRWYLWENRVHCGEPGAVYLPSNPSSADYYVEADYVIYSDILGAGIAARMSDTNLTAYVTRYEYGQYILIKFVAGVYSEIGAWAASHTGQHKLRLTCTGSTISVQVDGVTRISVTDSSITAAGHAGMASAGANDVGTGKHIDNFVGVDGLSASGAHVYVFGLIG
jgi:hypothetical protein